MTPLTINLSPEQSAEADAWQDGASYTLQVQQTAPGQFTATEIGPATEMPAEEPEPEMAPAAAAPAPAPAGGRMAMGRRPSNPAIAILVKGGRK